MSQADRNKMKAESVGEPAAEVVEELTLPPQQKASGQTVTETRTLAPSEIESGDATTLLPTEGGGMARDLVLRPVAKARYFGDYELLEEIARGGMGVVYKARQLSLNRIVALKMILAGQLASEQDVRRFYTEAEAAANLDHQGIVPIFEVGEHEDQHYFSMGFIEGDSLATLLKDGPLPPREAAEYAKKIAVAIAYAHEQGVIHRDLKPANVLLDKDGQPRVTDFGLAKRVEGESNLTSTGQILGTPGYMPPEQASGANEVGPASDVYSLGATLYALLTGRPPFCGGTDLDALLLVLEGEPTPPRQLNRAVDRNLETICLKCLEKDPRNRYGSALELAEDLERYLEGELIVARPLGPWGRIRRWARRYPALAATLVALCLFYANHLFAFYILKVPGETGAFHVFATGLALVWATGAAMFQYMAQRPNAGSAATYGWAGMDVLLFTVFLWAADGPKSTVLFGYLLLVAGSALRFRTGLVWFVTVWSMSGYICLVIESHWCRPHLAPPPAAILPFLMSLPLLGLIMHLMLRRIRRLTSGETVCDTSRASRTRGAIGRGLSFRAAIAAALAPTKPLRKTGSSESTGVRGRSES